MNKLLTNFDNTEVEHETMSSIFTLQNRLDYFKCKAFLLDRQSIFKLQKCKKCKLYSDITIRGAWFTF